MKKELLKLEEKTILRASVCEIICRINSEGKLKKNEDSHSYNALSKFVSHVNNYKKYGLSTYDALHNNNKAIHKSRLTIELLLGIIKKLQDGSSVFELNFYEKEVILESLENYNQLLNEVEKVSKCEGITQKDTYLLYLTSLMLYMKFNDPSLILYSKRWEFRNAEKERTHKIINKIHDNVSDEQTNIREVFNIIK